MVLVHDAGQNNYSTCICTQIIPVGPGVTGCATGSSIITEATYLSKLFSLNKILSLACQMTRTWDFGRTCSFTGYYVKLRRSLRC